MAYDIRKSSINYGRGKKVWGREYFHTDSMGIMVPVMFTPYFDWSGRPFGKYPEWENVDGKLVRKKDKHGRNLSRWRFNWWDETLSGIKQVWQDLPRIIRKQWYWEELED